MASDDEEEDEYMQDLSPPPQPGSGECLQDPSPSAPSVSGVGRSDPASSSPPASDPQPGPSTAAVHIPPDSSDPDSEAELPPPFSQRRQERSGLRRSERIRARLQR